MAALFSVRAGNFLTRKNILILNLVHIVVNIFLLKRVKHLENCPGC